MARITVYTDASHCRNTRAAGWAAWISKGSSVVRRSGAFRSLMSDSGHAEMAAAANGLFLAAKMAKPGDHVVLVTDCMEVVSKLSARRDKTRDPRVGREIEVAKAALSARNLKIKLEHVKAHTNGDDAQSNINKLVDEQSKIKMLEAKQILVEQKELIKATNQGVVCYTSQTLDGVGQLSIFDGAIKPDVDALPILLKIHNPARIRVLPGANALDIMVAMRDGGVYETRHLARALVKVIDCHRGTSTDGWARTCENAGLVVQGSLQDNPLRARQQCTQYTARDVTQALVGRQRSGPSLAADIARSGIQDSPAALAAANQWIIRSLEMAGYDGLQMLYPDATTAYAILHDWQASCMPQLESGSVNSTRPEPALPIVVVEDEQVGMSMAV